MQFLRRYQLNKVVTIVAPLALAGCQYVNLDTVRARELADQVRNDTVNEQYELANRLCCGDQPDKNSAQAYFLYCSAAKEGHKESQFALAALHEKGLPLHQTGDKRTYFLLPEDPVKAHMWYWLSDKAGYKPASRARKKLFQNLNHDQKNESYALLKQWRTQSCSNF